jgi:hypothetical protein
MYRSRRTTAALASALLGMTAVAALVAIAAPASAAVPVRGTFFPLDPSRVLDTRDGTGVAGQHRGPLGAGQITKLHMTGVAGVPSTGAGAVVLNLTATEAPGAGFVTAFPCGLDRPHASSLNFTKGLDVPNQVTVKLGTNGDVCFFAAAQTQLIADVSGYYADDFAAVPGFRYHELEPARLLDTRDGTGLPAGRAVGPFATNEVLPLTVIGVDGVPASGVRAITMNVTAVDPASAGYLSVFPCDRPKPVVSNLNFDPAVPAVANLVTVRVPDSGQICIYASASVQVVVDVQGYFSPGPGAVFTAVAPARVLDTRDGTGVASQHPGPLGRGDVFKLVIAGTNGVPVDARAVLLNVTVTDANGPGFVTVFPCGRPTPRASNLNFVRGVDRANLVKVKVGVDNSVCFFAAENTQLVADIEGYFTLTSAV